MILINILFYNVDIYGYVSAYIFKNYIVNLMKNKNVLLIGALKDIDTENFSQDIICTIPFYNDDSIDIEKINYLIDNKFRIRIYYIGFLPGNKNIYFENLFFKLFNDLIVINHAIKDIEYIEDFLKKNECVNGVPGLRQSERGVCELAALYIKGNEDIDLAYKSIPAFLKLLGRREVYDIENIDFDWDTMILPFFYGLYARINDINDIPLNDFTIDNLLSFDNNKPLLKNRFEYDLLSKICNEGEAILSYIEDKNKKFFYKNAHRSHVAFVLNNVIVDELNDSIWMVDCSRELPPIKRHSNDDETIHITIQPDIIEEKYQIMLYINSVACDTTKMRDITFKFKGHIMDGFEFNVSTVKYERDKNLLILGK
jgi:hypothetical protein